MGGSVQIPVISTSVVPINSMLIAQMPFQISFIKSNSAAPSCNIHELYMHRGLPPIAPMSCDGDGGYMNVAGAHSFFRRLAFPGLDGPFEGILS